MSDEAAASDVAGGGSDVVDTDPGSSMRADTLADRVRQLIQTLPIGSYGTDAIWGFCGHQLVSDALASRLEAAERIRVEPFRQDLRMRLELADDLEISVRGVNELVTQLAQFCASMQLPVDRATIALILSEARGDVDAAAMLMLEVSDGA